MIIRVVVVVVLNQRRRIIQCMNANYAKRFSNINPLSVDTKSANVGQ